MRSIICTVIGLLFLIRPASAQLGITTAGIQIKPILPVSIFSIGNNVITRDIYTATVTPKTGISYGGVIRIGVTDRLSVETGLHYVRRNYRINVEIENSDSYDASSFSYINFELPVQGMIFIRVAERLFINTALGIALNMWPSSIQTVGERNFILHKSFIQSRANFSFIGNIGVEWRTPRHGSFYLGTSLNNPFNVITAATVIDYQDRINNHSMDFITQLRGDFISIDLRYLFN